MNWRAAVTVARLTARLAMPRSLWALFLVALIVIVLVAVAVLKEPVESGSRGAFWLAMAQAFSGMGLAVLCTLLGDHGAAFEPIRHYDCYRTSMKHACHWVWRCASQ